MLESRSAWWSLMVLATTRGTGSRLPKLRSANRENSMSRFAWLVMCLVLSALTVVGLVHVPDAAAQKKVLNIAAKEPDTLDPHSSTLGQSQAISRFIFRGLTR